LPLLAEFVKKYRIHSLIVEEGDATFNSSVFLTNEGKQDQLRFAQIINTAPFLRSLSLQLAGADYTLGDYFLRNLHTFPRARLIAPVDDDLRLYHGLGQLSLQETGPMSLQRELMRDLLLKMRSCRITTVMLLLAAVKTLPPGAGHQLQILNLDMLRLVRTALVGHRPILARAMSSEESEHSLRQRFRKAEKLLDSL
jgi:hypothetical protein